MQSAQVLAFAGVESESLAESRRVRREAAKSSSASTSSPSTASLLETLEAVLLLVKKVFDFREEALSSSGMIVLLLKQVHLQKEVGAGDNVKSAVVVVKGFGTFTGCQRRGEKGKEGKSIEPDGSLP